MRAVCWAAEITSDEPTPGIKSTAMRGSLLQLSTGKVGTHSGLRRVRETGVKVGVGGIGRADERGDAPAQLQGGVHIFH